MQKQYGKKIQLLKITHQPKTLVLPFLEKFNKGKSSVIPVITDDKVFNDLFPHIYIPHYVWLDQSGKVVAVTSGEQLTAENIDRFLSTANIGNMPVKFDMDTSKPLFVTNELLKNNPLQHYSVFFKYRYYGLGCGIEEIMNDAGIKTGLSMTNLTLEDLYGIVVSRLFAQRGIINADSRRIIRLKDPSRIIGLRLENRNLYTYACNSPELKNTSLYEYVLEDLNRYTDYIGSIEKTKVKCLVLKRNGVADLIKTKGGPTQRTLFRGTDSKLINASVKVMMVSMMELPFIKMPLVDETGYTSKIDISLKAWTDLPVLQKELKAYGLELQEKERELDMFILRDKN